MEIITYVRKGAITHRDHLGNDGRTVAGDVQVMSAGRGIEHEEHNREDGLTQIFQIWIFPNENGVKPGWETRAFPKDDQSGALVTLASGRAADSGALRIHQDAAILAANLQPGQTVRHGLEPGRFLYLVPATGLMTVNGKPVKARDGVAITGEDGLEITASEPSEILIADVPAL
jgi:redox-sensitive bicupin YhaK (pirin superfamily)